MDLGDHPCALLWSLDGSVLASAGLNGNIAICGQNGSPSRLWSAHAGGVLDLDWLSPNQILSVGEDGCLCWWSVEGRDVQSQSFGKAWVEHVRHCGENCIVAAVGKQLFVMRDDGARIGEPLVMPSTISDMCLLPNERIVAVAHYGGVTLVDLVKAVAIRRMTWKGSLLHLASHPKASWLVSSSQEQGVIVFGMAEQSYCAIDHFPGKVHSMSWTHDGTWLAMAGGNLLLVWPFDGLGPVDRESIPIGIDEDDASDWTCLDFNPHKKVLAAGNALGEIYVFFKDDPDDHTLSFSIIQKLPQAVASIKWHPFKDDLAVVDAHGKVNLVEGVEF